MCYLDALRGYLAFIIFTGHTMSRHWRWIPEPVIAVPWLEFFFRGGHASLDIFFWISGYAITYKVVGFMHAGKSEKVLETLASSVFRRYLRLFLPVVCTTFVTIVAVKTGLAIMPGYMKGMLDGNMWVFFINDTITTVNPFAHVTSWYTKNGRAGTQLLEQFWSINTEFRSSMMLYMFCVATCKMPSSKRKMLICMCIPMCLYWQVQWAAMAFFGMWSSECRQQRTREAETLKLAQKAAAALPPSSSPPAPVSSDHINTDPEKRRHSVSQDNAPTPPSKLSRLLSSSPTNLTQHSETLARLRTPFLYALFLYSFVSLHRAHDYGTRTVFPHPLLNRIAPAHWAVVMKMHFHLVVGVSMMLYPLDRLPRLQRPLLAPFSQFLGELSFGIYAVHITVRWIVWEPRYLKWLQARHGKEFDFFWLLLPGYLFMALCVLWAAELFRRMDVQVVKLCKYLEDRLFEQAAS